MDTLVNVHLIQSAWNGDSVISVYLLLGLSPLKANDKIGSYNEPEIILANVSRTFLKERIQTKKI